jgi:prephenate dehydrogenase
VTKKVAIVGLGLIGGSMGAAFRRSGHFVRGYDANSGVMDSAKRLGLVDDLAEGPKSCVVGVNAVFLAVPVMAILGLLPVVGEAAPNEAIIIDAGSVKKPIVEAMQLLPSAHRMVGGHPLAGNEHSGPGSSDPDLFLGRPFLLCGSKRTSPQTMDDAYEMVRVLGAEPAQLSAEEHDQILARTSHVPQFVSTLLASCLEPGDFEYAGPGLRDMTRLAASEPAMWRDIAISNSANIAMALRVLAARLNDAAEFVETVDIAAIETLLQDGRATALNVKKVASR